MKKLTSLTVLLISIFSFGCESNVLVPSEGSTSGNISFILSFADPTDNSKFVLFKDEDMSGDRLLELSDYGDILVTMIAKDTAVGLKSVTINLGNEVICSDGSNITNQVYDLNTMDHYSESRPSIPVGGIAETTITMNFTLDASKVLDIIRVCPTGANQLRTLFHFQIENQHGELEQNAIEGFRILQQGS